MNIATANAEPATGKFELTSAKLSPTIDCPITTIGQLQVKKGPPTPRPRA